MTPGPRAPRAHILGIAAALALAGLGYSRALDGEFVFDDRTAIEERPAIKDLGRYLTQHFPNDWLGGKRPVADLTFALNYAAGRLQPRGYHLVNLALHLFLAVLLWRLGALLLARGGAGRAGLAVFAASAWAVHPLGTQAVSYVVQRGEVLAALGAVATILLLLLAETAPRGIALTAAATVCAVLANGSKNTAITLPALYLLAVVAFPRSGPRRDPWWRPLAHVAPVALVCAAFAVGLMRDLERDTTAGFRVPGVTSFGYALTQAHVVLDYLRLTFLPTGQNLDHDVPFRTSADAGSVAAVGLNLALIAAAAWMLWRARRLDGQAGHAARAAGFGVLWFYLVLSPTSSVVPVVDAMVEHRAYLASWGLLLAGAAGASWLFGKWRLPQAAIGACAALVVCAYAGALWSRNEVWQSKLALWRDVVEKSPRKARGHMNLGQALAARGELAGAEAAYRSALALGGPSVVREEVLRNLAALLIGSKRGAEAEALLEEGLRSAPRNADLLNNLAVLELEKGQLDRAEPLARTAIEAAPTNGNGYNTLGEILLARGQDAQSLELFQQAVALDPDISSRHWNVAVAAERLGRSAEACAALQRHDAIEKGTAELAESAQSAQRLGCAQLQPP